MDDLRMLRRFGEELEHEPPATLARQRQRLLDGLSGAPGRPRPRLSRWTLGWAMAGLAAGVTAAVLVAPSVLLEGLGRVADPVPSPAGDRPAKPNGALNVLLLGTDSRAASPSAGRGPGARSDTMLLVHLSANRGKVGVISIPRDSMARIPACADPAGTPLPARTDMINSAFATGGLSCVWKTVESLTGVRVDHALEVDFSGFKGMVNALGGVEVTLPEPVNDPKAKLRLPKGKQTLNGDQALGYMRARYTLGDGSDLERIKRQQRFMRALAKQAGKLRTDPARLSAFVAEAGKWIKTDAGLDLATMQAIARSLERTDPGAVEFVTVPVRPYAADPNRLEWDDSAAKNLFARVRNDTM
ncbi:LCP family protein [Streptosporangium sp. NPDC051023]|uniref:LCP family glycopolymer transferase n=1 Tax=Streptosporangium sp. NPDC051023 TaxID=3155410 RepID=UPI00344E0615